MLTLVGGVLGFLWSWIALGVINGSGWIPHANMQMSLRVFAAGFLLSLMFAVISGTYPAWRMSRLNPVEALRGRAR